MATVLTDIGRAITTGSLRRLSTGVGSAEPKFVAVGTGAGTSARTDTALFSEVARVAGTSSQTTTAVANDTYTVVGTVTATSGTGAIGVTNAGLLDASASGNLFLKGDFSVVNLSVGDSIQITASLQLS